MLPEPRLGDAATWRPLKAPSGTRVGRVVGGHPVFPPEPPPKTMLRIDWEQSSIFRYGENRYLRVELAREKILALLPQELIAEPQADAEPPAAEPPAAELPSPPEETMLSAAEPPATPAGGEASGGECRAAIEAAGVEREGSS